MNWISRLLINSLAVITTSYLLPGVEVASVMSAIIVALVLSLLNFFLKPILIIITIPVTIMSLGLFLLVINAAIILLADDLVDGFVVDSFWSALLFSIVLSLINSIFERIDKKDKNRKKHQS